MLPNIHLLSVFLLCTGLFIPASFFVSSRLNSLQINSSLETLLRYWLRFFVVLLILRILVSLLLMFTDFTSSSFGFFYPIRIAFPNYQLLAGLPYLVLCLAVLAGFVPLKNFIINRNYSSYFYVWIFSIALLLVFGGIHGGFFYGNAWIAISPEHLADASLNMSIVDIFATHAARILGHVMPAYQAAHSMSHPAGSIVFSNIILRHSSPFMFSLINVMLFSLAFPIMYWALRRKNFDNTTAFLGVMACLFVPAMLIYGRSDDAIFYSIAGICVALIAVAIQEEKYFLTLIVGILFAIAINFSYASIVLLAAMFVFNAEMPLKQVVKYLCKIAPHVFIILAIALTAIILELKLTGYNWFDAFKASVDHNKPTNIIALLHGGEYLRALNERVMAVCDFLIFAGPLFLYFFVCLTEHCTRNVGEWRIKNIALVFVLIFLGINSNGPGELSRPWGMLFILIGFSWLSEFLSQQNESTRWLLVRVQFVWALILQGMLNFGW